MIDGYGRVNAASSGSPSNAYDYEGGEGYERLGNYLLVGARAYDPTTGTFLQRDPVSSLGYSDYSYCGGDPINASDPLGLAYVGSHASGKKHRPSLFNAVTVWLGNVWVGLASEVAGYAIGQVADKSDLGPEATAVIGRISSGLYIGGGIITIAGSVMTYNDLKGKVNKATAPLKIGHTNTGDREDDPDSVDSWSKDIFPGRR